MLGMLSFSDRERASPPAFNGNKRANFGAEVSIFGE